MKTNSGPAEPAGALSIDRRSLMHGAALSAAFATLGGAGASLAQTTAKPSSEALMPDGSAFPRWEQPLSFTKTYHVDNGAPNADDDGPGDAARPFRTIGKAAQVLQPGERVVIASGIYRECVRPARGGTGPGQMISYEAAPGAKVYVRGSEVLKDGWRQETVRTGPPGANAAPGVTVWRHNLSSALFPDAYNPFALPSIMGSWGWLDGRTVDLGPYLRRRGLVFADGKPLEPMEQLRELAMAELPKRPDFTRPPAPQAGMPPRRRGGAVMQEIGGSPTARFWTDHSGTAIYVRLESGTPADHLIEATTRQHVFVPAVSGCGYIRVKGITFQHAGNAYPFPQYGMISLAGGDHWIIEDNTVEWANGMGLAIGNDGYSAGAPRTGAAQIIRRNSFRYCGIEAIGGMGTTNTLIEDNLIEWCGWADAERGWEAAGAKFHRAKTMLFRRNVIRHIRFANGAWWDVDNENCRITQNVFADIVTVGSAIHIEMTPGRNAIDNNIIWDVRNAEPGTPGQRGCAGSGIFINASDNLIIVQNLIGACETSGVFAIARPDRNGGGTGKLNTISNNIFAECGKSAIVFLSRENTADGNLYVDMPKDLQGLFEGDLSVVDPQAWTQVKYRDLAAWRDAFGWDKASVIADGEIDFDPETLQLTLALTGPPPKVRAIGGIESDILGQAAGASRPAGPLADPRGAKPRRVDPRASA